MYGEYYQLEPITDMLYITVFLKVQFVLMCWRYINSPNQNISVQLCFFLNYCILFAKSFLLGFIIVFTLIQFTCFLKITTSFIDLTL